MDNINPNNITCLIPNHNGANVLDICLSTMKHYVFPTLKNVYVIDRESEDNSQQIVEKHGCNFISLPINTNRILDAEYSDSIEHGISLVQTEWILILHNDMEFVDLSFWEEINKCADGDMVYAEMPITSHDDHKYHSAPKSCFILARKQFYLDAKLDGITHHSRCDSDNFYDVYYDLWKWAEEKNKKILQLANHDFYIHYRGYSLYRMHPEFKNRGNILLYNHIFDELIKLKIQYLNNKPLPFPSKMQKILCDTLKKDAHSVLVGCNDA